MRVKKCVFYIYFCLLGLILASLVSCKGGSAYLPDLTFSDKPFSAELEGNIDGVIFSARLECPAEYSKDAEREYVLTFTSPESLSGLVLRRDANGETSASLGNIVLSEKSNVLVGMALPAEVLLCRKEIAGILKSDEGYILRSDGEELFAEFLFESEEKAFPTKVSGEWKGISFEIRIKQI